MRQRKRCTKCGKDKPTSAFGVGTRRKGKTYLRSYCRECARVLRKQWYDAGGSDYYREYRQNNPDKLKRAGRKSRLKTVYGLTEEALAKMLARQKRRCAICNRKAKRGLHIDHNHETGVVRGLLCSQCNTGLGLFQDDPWLLRRAAG